MDRLKILFTNKITIIESRTFYECFNLSSVYIPDGVTEIGQSAFEYCFNLTTINIPDSVTVVAHDAFDSCYSLSQEAQRRLYEIRKNSD